MASPTLALSPTARPHHPHVDDDGLYEYSHGEPITRPQPNFEHDWIKATVAEILLPHILLTKSGKIFTEARFLLGEALRIPDVAFVGNAKLAQPLGQYAKSPFVPDLAIEVISPSETVYYSELKVQDYLSAGVPEVWQLLPETRTIRVRTPGAIRDVRPDESLETPVFHGFAALADHFFPPK